MGLLATPICFADCVAQAQPSSQLVELYTSEGCSSCPPADRWLASLDQQQNTLIPLSFHVDYWNGLGWADPFSNAAFSQRQRVLADRANATVYTPGVFLSGLEWRSWGGSASASAATHRSALSATAKLRARQLSIALGTDQQESTIGYVAIAENGLETQVPRGENAGRKLHHAHVVRALQPISFRNQSAAMTMTIPTKVKLDQAEVVVWLEEQGKASSVLRMPLATCQASEVVRGK